jgi:hypothetical protein
VKYNKNKKKLKNKVEAISVVVKYHSENELEPELRPDFVKRVLDDEKNDNKKDYLSFKSIKDLDKHIREKSRIK